MLFDSGYKEEENDYFMVENLVERPVCNPSVEFNDFSWEINFKKS